jgi:hypothetical protein
VFDALSPRALVDLAAAAREKVTFPGENAPNATAGFS